MKSFKKSSENPNAAPDDADQAVKMKRITIEYNKALEKRDSVIPKSSVNTITEGQSGEESNEISKSHSSARSTPREEATGAKEVMQAKILDELGEAMRRKLLIKQVASNEEDNQTNEFIRSILEKKPKRRSGKEIDTVVELLQNNDFFRSKTQIKKEDMKELVAALKFQIIGEGEPVVTYGDPGKCMYILLKGQVSVHVPNQMIKDWKQKRLQYAILTNFKNSLEANYKYLREQKRKEINR